MGFDRVDLTVRPKGHVEPATVKTDLPKAIKEIEKGGSKCVMLTTAIEGVHNPLGGAEKGKRNLTIKPEVLVDAMKRDLNALKQLWKEA